MLLFYINVRFNLAGLLHQRGVEVLQVPNNAHARAAQPHAVRDLERGRGDARAALRRARALLQPAARLRGGGQADPPALVPRRHAHGRRRPRAAC